MTLWLMSGEKHEHNTHKIIQWRFAYLLVRLHTTLSMLYGPTTTVHA